MEKSIFKKFAKFVSLNILGMLGLSCYILADTYFVANVLGETGLAALTLSISVYSVIQGFGLMIGIGGSTKFSILKSRDKNEEADKVFSTSIKLGLIVGIVFAIIGFLGSRHVALALGADANTLPLTEIYLATILTFSPFFIINNVMLAFTRNDNAPKLSMTALLLGSFLNIALDYILMYPLGMGMFGAALATGLSSVVSLCILMPHFMKKKNSVALLKHKVVWRLVPNIVGLGTSTFIIEISSAIALIIFNLIILAIEGNQGVAAYGIIVNLALVATAVFAGLAQGIQPLTSKYYGLGKHTVVGQVYKLAIITSIILATTMYIGIIYYSDTIIAAFNGENSAAIFRIAKGGLQIYFIGFFFVGINIVTAMCLSTTEKSLYAFFISITRGFVIIIPAVFTLSKIADMTGVWLAFVITEVIVAILALFLSNDSKKAAMHHNR